MEFALTIIALLGFLLFLLSYLRFIFAGFKHHPVTGLIAAIPVINLLVLPTLWYRTGKFLIVGAVSLLIAIGAWTMGGERSVNRYVGLLLGNRFQEAAQSSAMSKPTEPRPTMQSDATLAKAPAASDTGKIKQAATPTASEPTPVLHPAPALVQATPPLDESNLLNLPVKALYRMRFEDVPVNNIATLSGRIVRVLDKDQHTLEGRVRSVSASSVIIQATGSSADIELPIANIKKLSLMVKRPL